MILATIRLAKDCQQELEGWNVRQEAVTVCYFAGEREGKKRREVGGCPFLEPHSDKL